MSKIAPRETDGFLKNPFAGKTRAVLFYGPNKGQIRDFAKKCCALAVPDINDAFNVTQINGETFDSGDVSLRDEMNAFSMFGGRKLIYIRYADDKIAASIETALTDYVGDNVMVVEADELTPKSTLRKLSETLPSFASVACYEESTADVMRLIEARLRENGFTLERSAGEFLSSVFSGNRDTAFAELEKLMLYIGFPNKGEPIKQVTYEDARACVGDRTENDTETLCLAIAGGQFDILDKTFYSMLNEGMAEVGMLRAVQNYFARLQQVHYSMLNGDTRDRAIDGLFPKIFFKTRPTFEKHLSLWSLPALDNAQSRLVKTESAVKKSGTPTAELTHRTFMALAQQSVAANRR